jgi:hypothetical protein
MSRRKAEQFEEALERTGQDEPMEGQLASLMQVSQRARTLADPPPAPPYRLSPGRQRLLAEAAHLRATTTRKRKERLPMRGIMKPAIVLMAIVLLFGSVFGVGQAAAASLPGESLYGLKLATEDARQSLTTDPKASADLNLALAERRMDEVVQLVEQGQTVDDQATNRVEQQLTATLGAAVELEDKEAAEVLEKLGEAIQVRQNRMAQLQVKGEQPEAPVRNLVRVMQRVRNDTDVGQGNPDALRQRHGTPPEAEDMPDPADQPGAGPRVQPGEGAGDGSGNGSGDGSGDGPGPGPKSPEDPPKGGENGQGGSGGPPEDSPGAGGPGSEQGEGQGGQGGSNGEGQHGRP